MFYAIEYAYGRDRVNNGNRADRVVEFTRRDLRDVWVQDGNPSTDTGSRDALPARDARVRNAYGLEDGDNEAWNLLARERASNSKALSGYVGTIIDYDWGDPKHGKWVATASEKEIISWAEAIATKQKVE